MKLSPLMQRICTALVLIPLVLILLFTSSGLVFKYLVSALFLLAAWEWARLMGITDTYKKLLYVCIFALLFIFVNLSATYAIIIAALVWWLVATIWVFYYAKTGNTLNLGLILYGLIGILVILPCWQSFIVIQNMPRGPFLILFILLLVWSVDTGAYFVGKRFGGPKLIPTVSPGKTWAGLWGGLITGLVVALVGAFFFHLTLTNSWRWLVWSFVTILISIIGDLFISVMKRQQKIKDSGNILPGHGGILDRIDSLTSAMPIFTFGLLVLGIY